LEKELGNLGFKFRDFMLACSQVTLDASIGRVDVGCRQKNQVRPRRLSLVVDGELA